MAIKASRLIIFFILSGFSFLAWAESLYERRLRDGRYVFDAIVSQGVPREALHLIFRMFDYNEGGIPNTTYAVLVDYSLISTRKRFYLLNLWTAKVETFFVSHGIRSGVLETRYFSNLQDSWQSSLGFYYAKDSYISSKNGLSLYLQGIDRSNNNAKLRNIVLHGAKYVSEEFIAQNGRLGWSEGCFAVELLYVKNLVDLLKNGSILLSYHKDLMAQARSYPWEQNLSGQEWVPAGVNRERVPGEGGGIDLQDFIFDDYYLAP